MKSKRGAANRTKSSNSVWPRPGVPGFDFNLKLIGFFRNYYEVPGASLDTNRLVLQKGTELTHSCGDEALSLPRLALMTVLHCFCTTAAGA
jgi:hypothetical protein